MLPLIPLSQLLGVPLSLSLISLPIGPLDPVPYGPKAPSHSLMLGL